MQLTLYHGTNNVAAQQILRENKYIACKKYIHYLGQGIYFYDNESKAERWIRIYYSGNGIILKNEILVNNSDVFDMRNHAHRKQAIGIVKDVQSKFVLTKDTVDDIEYIQRKRCFLYDAISKETACKLLIGFVVTNNSLWELSCPEEKELQYCVKDASIIKKILYMRNVGVSIV
ncbi:MAG: hypothetical protein HFE46_07250 [Clostridia bacterium]|nr:hypothetical protein [Clostridia bacterium]